MGSEYHMQYIDRWETINGVEVPIARSGAYLDCEGISDNLFRWATEVYAAESPQVSIEKAQDDLATDQPSELLRWAERHADFDESQVKARDLTTPYGILHYAVGNGEGDEECDGDWTMFFDFAELPDGRIVLDSTCNSESGGFIKGGGYHVATKEAAPGVALGMVDLACECVTLNEVRHDTEGWNQDEYYFVRAVAAYCGVEPYASMTDAQLRHGDRPDFEVDFMGVLDNELRPRPSGS